MKKILLLLLMVCLFGGCRNKKDPGSVTVTIEGNIKNVPDGKMYLVRSRQWKTPLDSTVIKNGRFRFHTRFNDPFSPFLAAIHYWDSSGVKRLLYRNHTLGNDSLQYATDAFYLEPGHIEINGDNGTAPYLRIVAGKENELLFRNQFVDFGWIGTADSTDRLKKISSFIDTIRQHPYSYFLLESIYRSKEQYSKSELESFFSLFNSEVKQSKEGAAYQEYLSLRPGDKDSFPNLVLLTPENTTRKIFDPDARIQMLVFWASWCTPCRKEIPLLKDIEKKFGGTGLHMISISIDENKEQWLKAVADENMNWTQVHVPREQIGVVQNQFRFVTIPLIIFTDKTGKEIKRFADYDPDNSSAYESLISTYLK